jgi:pimeloyl-[acyl-carrier protein] methyl ester esterase
MTTRRCFLIVCAALAVSACSSAVQTEAPVNSARAFTSNDVSVVTRGSGPDVILIHGLAGHTGVWAESAEALDDRYRLHLVQIHGFGGVARTSSDSLVTTAVAGEVARYS